MANCTLIRPLTLRALAIIAVWRLISAITSADSEYGGRLQAESPECTPACSMCSMTPPMKTVSPSDRQSTSTSVALFRKRSSSTGESLLTLTASRM